MGSEGMVTGQAWALGIVDVGLIVLSHCENPAKNEAIDFLEKVFLGEINAKIPVSCFIGAYHVMTRYLRVRRRDAARELIKTLELRSPTFIQDLNVGQAIAALKNAEKYRIEAWDGYLVALADSLGASIIYTIDSKLTRAKHLSIVIPISELTLAEYHRWLKKKLELYRRDS